MSTDDAISPEVHEHIEPTKEFWRNYYDEEVRETLVSDTRSVYVDYDDFREFSPSVARDTLEQPETGFEILHESLCEYARDEYGDIETIDDEEIEQTQVRIYNLPRHSQIDISDIREEHINRLRAIDAMVRNTTQPTTLVKDATFQCARCETIKTVEQNTESFTEPNQCRGCERQGPFHLLEDQSTFRNYQKLQVQEPHDKQEISTETRKKVVHVEEELVDEVAPGDRVTITGTVEIKPVDDNSPQFEYHIYANSIEIDDTTYEEIELDEDDRERIQKLADNDDIEQRIIDSIAPSIYGYEEEKRALAYQLFGGLPKNHPDETRTRGDIHVLLAGDPGTAKSSLLDSVHKLSPRSVQATGTDATKAGLTSAATKTDFGDGEKYELQAGVLPLADKGMACVDEFDKLSESQRQGLNDALVKDQELSVNKAGLNASLKTRCSLLAAANPEHGRFDPYEGVAAQIDMDGTVVSRFDLIFTFKDEPDEEMDEKIADHILTGARAAQKHERDGKYPEEQVAEPEIEAEILRKYVAYAKKNCKPVLTDEAKEELKQFYTLMRSGASQDGPIPVTARELDALIRVAESRARLHLSDKITEEDAKRTIQLVNESLKQTIIDENGNYDADMVETGASQAQKDRRDEILETLSRLQDESENGKVKAGDLIAEIDGDDELVRKDIDALLREGKMIEPEGGMYRRT
jgi:replicative DNA helicase Mcm